MSAASETSGIPPMPTASKCDDGLKMNRGAGTTSLCYVTSSPVTQAEARLRFANVPYKVLPPPSSCLENIPTLKSAKLERAEFISTSDGVDIMICELIEKGIMDSINLPTPELEEEDQEICNKLIECADFYVLPEEVWDEMEALLEKAKESAVDWKPFWLLGGDGPSGADALLFGLIIAARRNKESATQLKVRGLPHATDYMMRIHDAYFSEYKLQSIDGNDG